eukprot:1159960-Pelagomonas_calceolata.AAC.5
MLRALRYTLVACATSGQTGASTSGRCLGGARSRVLQQMSTRCVRIECTRHIMSGTPCTCTTNEHQARAH